MLTVEEATSVKLVIAYQNSTTYITIPTSERTRQEVLQEVGVLLTQLGFCDRKKEE